MPADLFIKAVKKTVSANRDFIPPEVGMGMGVPPCITYSKTKLKNTQKTKKAIPHGFDDLRQTRRYVREAGKTQGKRPLFFVVGIFFFSF